MPVTIRCQCSRMLMVSEELAGQPTRCPSCGRRHIVPAMTKPEPRGPELSGENCTDCRTPLLKDAAFCHSCGLPAKAPETAVAPKVGPVQAVAMAAALPRMVIPAQVPMNQPLPASVAPTAPVAPQNAAPAMASPFAGRVASIASNAHGCCSGAQQGPFAKAASNACGSSDRPQSGFGKVSMTCAYMTMFLGLFTVVFSLPLFGHTFNSAELSGDQAASLYKLLAGVMGLTGVFGVIGVVSGFFGLFHCGRRKSAAFWGMVLSIVMLNAFHHGKEVVDSEYRVRFKADPPKCEMRWCKRHRDQQPQEITTPKQQPATPKKTQGPSEQF